MNEVINWL